MRRGPALILAFALACFARADGPGLPLLRVIPQSEHGAGPQTFDVAQNRRGLLYFGNLAGVLTYDGAWWNVVALPNASAVFAVESDSAGVIAVGAVGEFGYLTAANEYRSLVPQLPPSQRDVGDVRGLCTSERGFVFATERYAIEWNGGAPHVLAEIPAGTRCGRGGLFWNGHGLHRLERGLLLPAGLPGKRVDAAVALDEHRTLAAVRDEGLFLVDHNGFATSLGIAAPIVNDMVRLRDGGVAVATREQGVLLLDANLKLSDTLDHTAGLPDVVLASALVDAEGALWLAYYGPVVRVDLASPITVLDARRGVKGSSTAVFRHDGHLWITTSHGLFKDQQRVDGVPAPAWDVIAADGTLLVATSEGVFTLDGTPRRIAGTETLGPYTLRQSKTDPSRIWLAARKGLATLRRDGGSWRFERMVAGVPGHVRSLVEQDGVLWAGTIFNGVIRVGTGDAVRRFGSGEMMVNEVAGRLVITQNGRLFHVDSRGALAPDPLLGHLHMADDFFVAVEDGQGNVWLNTAPPRLVTRTRDGRYSRETIPLPGVRNEIASINRDPDGSIWFSSHDAVFRYSGGGTAPTQPLPLIRASAGAQPLPNDFGRLRVECAPLSYGTGVTYQYRLEPADAAWSAWTAEPFIDYTRLGGGDYTFRLRTRGAAGAVSEEARWSFSVLPPWYRKPLPIALALLTAAALVALIVMLRTRALRRQADRLRALVAERTQELSEANQHLERLALLDELTSIPNRRYFDRALARAFEVAREDQSPLALILLDLDYFKGVNDTHGHAAGDAFLIHVGRLLSQKIRRSGEFSTRRSGEFASRSGDVVARIGGEEFAVLLVRTDDAGATRTAETLRAAIASLEVAYDETPMRLTTSCGVATLTPRAADTPEQLVRRADAALYAAKAAGRNCVRVAEEMRKAASG